MLGRGLGTETLFVAIANIMVETMAGAVTLSIIIVTVTDTVYCCS